MLNSKNGCHGTGNPPKEFMYQRYPSLVRASAFDGDDLSFGVIADLDDLGHERDTGAAGRCEPPPVNPSAGPLAKACEPLRGISIDNSFADRVHTPMSLLRIQTALPEFQVFNFNYFLNISPYYIDNKYFIWLTSPCSALPPWYSRDRFI